MCIISTNKNEKKIQHLRSIRSGYGLKMNLFPATTTSLIIVFIISNLFQGFYGLKLNKVIIPAYKLRGESAFLECQYELIGRRNAKSNSNNDNGGGDGDDDVIRSYDKTLIGNNNYRARNIHQQQYQQQQKQQQQQSHYHHHHKAQQLLIQNDQDEREQQNKQQQQQQQQPPLQPPYQQQLQTQTYRIYDEPKLRDHLIHNGYDSSIEQNNNNNNNNNSDDDDDDEDEGEQLYAVKWYKDNEEFYRYVPKANPQKQSYRVDGIRVVEEHSDSTRVLLRGLTLNSTGLYRCEVSAEAPNFSSVQGEGRMDIVYLPRDGPHIRGKEDQYQIGDTLNLNCTSGKSHPASQLQWFINDKLIMHSSSLIHFNDTIHKHGLITSTLGLQLIVDARHFTDGAMRVKCLASISPVLWKGGRESVLQRRPGVIDNREAMLLVINSSSHLVNNIILIALGLLVIKYCQLIIIQSR